MLPMLTYVSRLWGLLSMALTTLPGDCLVLVLNLVKKNFKVPHAKMLECLSIHCSWKLWLAHWSQSMTMLIMNMFKWLQWCCFTRWRIALVRSLRSSNPEEWARAKDQFSKVTMMILILQWWWPYGLPANSHHDDDDCDDDHDCDDDDDDVDIMLIVVEDSGN